jgi:hypothetical protein
MTARIYQSRHLYVSALLWEQINRMWGNEQFPLFRGANDWRYEERRVHPRMACNFLVDYAVQDCFYRDFVRNVSLGGAFVESCKLPIGPEMTMVFSLSDADKPVKILGQVAWVDRDGIGVRFKP